MIDTPDKVESVANAMVKAGVKWLHENAPVNPEFRHVNQGKTDAEFIPINDAANKLCKAIDGVTEIIPKTAQYAALSVLTEYLINPKNN